MCTIHCQNPMCLLPSVLNKYLSFSHLYQTSSNLRLAIILFSQDGTTILCCFSVSKYFNIKELEKKKKYSKQSLVRNTILPFSGKDNVLGNLVSKRRVSIEGGKRYFFKTLYLASKKGDICPSIQKLKGQQSRKRIHERKKKRKKEDSFWARHSQEPQLGGLSSMVLDSDPHKFGICKVT